jgi:beta-RFAP synthase
MMGFELSAPARLHLGLLSWGIDPANRVGGAGIMLESPRVRLRAEESSEMKVTGGAAWPECVARVRAVANRVLEHIRASGRARAVSIELLETPDPHVGLGSGTALDLAVADAVCACNGRSDLPGDVLAAWTGRGRRSGVGLHGFRRGGLIVDGGRRVNELPAPLIAQLPVPETWRIVLIRAVKVIGLHGSDEEVFFDRVSPPGAKEQEFHAKLVLEELVPAAREGDLARFATAVDTLQEHVGCLFGAAQRGRFASAELVEQVQCMRRAGLRGVGQSSWGPTLFGFAESESAARKALAALPPPLEKNAIVTQGDNRGVRRLESHPSEGP